MNKGFWMAKVPGSLSDGAMVYDNSSRIEPKRSHQWFMDSSEAELFPNKKQAVEVPNHTSFSGLLNSNVSPWGNASSLRSAADQFTERLFDPETVRTINFDDRCVSSVGIGNMNVGRKGIEDPFGNDSSFGLSMSHALEDPRLDLNFGGIRKVKVSQVKDSENLMSVSIGHAYTRGENNTMSATHAYSKADDNHISMGLSFNRGDDNIMSMGDTYTREDSNFISMGQPYNKSDNIDISMGHTFKENNGAISMGHAYKENNSAISMGHAYKENNSAISMGQSLSKDDGNISTMGQTFSKGDGIAVSLGHTFNENNNAVLISQHFSKDSCNNTSVCQTFNNGADNTLSMGHSDKGDENSISMCHTYNNIVSNNNLSMGPSFGKGESNIISFGGGFNEDDDINPSGKLICSYDLLMGQPSVQRSETPSEKGLVESNTDALVRSAQSAFGETVSKKKEEQKVTKKAPLNNFPSNVRSLLSTGMLDGVPVKYSAWSREVNHRSFIMFSD
ncbi:unnamed protein product [Ilex paraguariensis]|uniref:Uncharacterized protein n=1 Tax=Ilex paraguariensis TaxID=185542 RepID=A0ABC8RSY9_9AQUA